MTVDDGLCDLSSWYEWYFEKKVDVETVVEGLTARAVVLRLVECQRRCVIITL